MLTLALALSAGEVVPALFSAAENHPFMESCGIARSIPDLLRLLSRFRPMALAASFSILEELVQDGLPPESLRHINPPVTFLLSEKDGGAGGYDLERILQLPLRIGGFIDRNLDDADHLFQLIKAKVDIYSSEMNGASQKQPDRKSASGIIAFTGCKGGVGTTLISCSFAAAAALGERRVVLLEMGGAPSQLYHIKSSQEGKTLADIAPMAEEISWDLLRVSLFKHPSGFYLLPSGRGNDRDHAHEIIAKGSFLRNLLFLFDAVVVDLRCPWNGGLSALIPYSPKIHLITPPDTLSTACARDAADFMRRSGMDASLIRLVINRHGNDHVLGQEEQSRATGLDIAATFPEDNRSGLDFAEMGRLPAFDSALGRSVAALAVRLGFAEIEALARRPRKLFAGFGGRRSLDPSPKGMVDAGGPAW